MEELRGLIAEYLHMYGVESTIIKKQQSKIGQLESDRKGLEDQLAIQQENFSRSLDLMKKVVERSRIVPTQMQEGGTNNRRHYFGKRRRDKPRNFSAFYRAQEGKVSTYNWLISLQIPNLGPIDYEVNTVEERRLLADKTILETTRYILQKTKPSDIQPTEKYGHSIEILLEENPQFWVGDNELNPNQKLSTLISNYEPDGRYIRLDIKITKPEV